MNALLTRYEIVRQRAAKEGNFVMSVEDCALQVLRALHASPHQLIQFLRPFRGRLPGNEQEFRAMTAHLRRLGHILEHAPNNLGHAVHGGHQARSGAYAAMESTENRSAFPVC